MADYYGVTETVPEGVPPAPADDENEALADLAKTFRWTAIGAVFFCGSALVFILMTRMG